MPSPIAHSLMGAAGYLALSPRSPKSFSGRLRENPGRLLLFVFASNLPDLDMLFGYLSSGNFHAFHGKASHSILAALVAVLAAGVLYPKSKNKGKVLLTVLVLILLHDFMDSAASPDLSRPGPGVWLFFPLREPIAFPVPVLFGFRHRTMEQLVSIRNLFVVGLELFEFSMVLFLLHVFKKKAVLFSFSHPGGK